MIKYVCDLCKKEVELDRYFEKFLTIDVTSLDLCKSCAEKVCDFLSNTKKPESFGDSKCSRIKGVRYNKKSDTWGAYIRFKNVEYQLGASKKGSEGYETACLARAEAVQVRDKTPEAFHDWYSKKYPEYTPIDRKMRGYSH